MQVSDFMEKLAKQTSSPAARTFSRPNRKIEKLSLNHPANLGRYQVIPFVSDVTDFPFVSGSVKQINIPRKNVDQSGNVNQYNAWIHIPSAGFYQMKDMSGRTVSSLTTEDEKLLSTASSLWDELYTELDGKNNWAAVKDLVRRRNYTLFTGYCLNFWKYGSADPRVPDRQNFSALFMITTKSFTSSIEENISNKSLMEGSQDWIDKVYNNDLKNRDGFLLFSVNKDRDRAGFTSSAQHEYGKSQMLSQVEISQEDFDAGMNDPVSLFLGWQASNQDADKPFGTRRLFNAALIKEAVDYMASMLAAVRGAKAAGTSVEEAIALTNQTAFDSAQTVTDTQGNPVGTADIAAKNTDPFHTPASSRVDPVTGAPVGSGNSAGFGGFGTAATNPFNSAPSFGAPAGESSSEGLPF